MNTTAMTAAQWNAIHADAVDCLVAANVPIESSELCLGGAASYDFVLLRIPAEFRAAAKQLLDERLGDRFVVRYHQKPNGYWQDGLYVFPADRAWPEATWTMPTW